MPSDPIGNVEAPKSEARGSKLEKTLKHGVLALALVLLAGISQEWIGQTGAVSPVSSRKAMPQLALRQLDGGVWKLDDHRGQVVLINFWATWCPPCRQETPGLVRLATEYRSKGLAVVGISMDEGGADTIRSFVNEFHMPYPIALPDSASPLVSSVESLPTTILVDRQGRGAKMYTGQVRESVFRDDVERLLAEQPGPKPEKEL
ncbi:MAG TPA: TlpA disulfide reductase family protein [Bryobacteraceae bacterium]|nr:TlpA disulfide reductase family protein [Bryobacteraceae bacterium]